jgi:hypothetical protein
MGYSRDIPATAPRAFGIDALLLDAIQKGGTDPLLVFVELNAPVYADLTQPDAIMQELRASWASVQNKAWGNGFQCIGVVFYNDVAPWFLREPLHSGRNNILAVGMWPNSSRYSLDVKPLLQRIALGCIQRASIPLQFPGER